MRMVFFLNKTPFQSSTLLFEATSKRITLVVSVQKQYQTQCMKFTM